MDGGGRNPGGRGGVPFNKRYSAGDMARLAQANRQAAMAHFNMVGGQSLDEIVNQNNQEQQRRRSFHQYLNPTQGPTGDGRANTIDFGSPAGSDLDGYSFGSSPMPHSPHPLGNGGGMAKPGDSRSGAQGTPGGTMTLDTSMGDMGVMEAMAQSPLYGDPMDTEQMNLDMPGNQFLDMSLDTSFGDAMDPSMGQGMGMYSQGTLDNSIQSPIHPNAGTPMRTPQDPSMGGMGDNMEQNMRRMNTDGFQTVPSNVSSVQPSPHRSLGGQTSSSGLVQGVSPNSAMLASQGSRSQSFGPQPPQQAVNIGAFGQQSMSNAPRKQVSQYLNAYSQSGFDMLGILMRVAARSKPQINIGAVDMSCAFVVCDVTQHDIPIVYCSEMFERLTGYVKHEILGRNCRFLQAPDGKVQSGLRRKYVDDKSVYYLKETILQRREAQISLINYRKGGQPFMNLLTMIPIPWDTDEIRYIVGFQVDLVEQPTSITNKNPDGSYSINYQRGLLPRYINHNTPENNRAKDYEAGHSIASDEVSSVLSTFGSGDSEYSKRIWDKVVIENTDDVVHVLSLKGLFLYISPAGKKVFEYEPSELVGTPLSSVCHPSDIVPVTRELKDTAPGATVNVVFRIRRKHSGYTWFESHGSLHTEQGKGKKCIILTGRERPVYALQRKEIVNVSEIGDNELWTKMSTSGMFLFVSTHSKSLLDRQPEDLVGTSAQMLMRRDSKEEFNRMLELARSGKIVTLKHDIQNRRGQTLHAQSTLYPGDAAEGTKPTFLIVQTKLLKMSRAGPGGGTKSSVTSGDRNDGSLGTGLMGTPGIAAGNSPVVNMPQGAYTAAGGHGFAVGTQHETLASEDNVFDELQTTRSTSWQFELRQMEKRNRVLAEELQSLNSSKKKRKRRKGLGQLQKDCANCHTRNTPEWRRGPSGNRDLCNSCGLRWAKKNGRVSPRTSSQQSDKASASPVNSSPHHQEMHSGNSMSPAGSKKTAQEKQLESHNAKMSHMEASKATSEYGGGISAKIDEGIEPMGD